MKAADSFLKRSGVWKGSLSNFVNQKGGIIQHGRLTVEMNIDEKGIITQKNSLFDSKGKKTDYEGVARMRSSGSKLSNLEPMTKDPNTGNAIQNHVLEGFVADNHIYIFESYDEILTDGKTEHRRNSLHYYFLDENKMVMISDVFVNNELLVFVNAQLEKEL